jgi:hypothetical protein
MPHLEKTSSHKYWSVKSKMEIDISDILTLDPKFSLELRFQYAVF